MSTVPQERGAAERARSERLRVGRTPAAGPVSAALIRRRRLVALGLVAACGLLLAWSVVAFSRGAQTMAPDEVELAIREPAAREFIRRTGDPTAALGRIDCVELKARQGNCLADATASKHQSDHVMVGIQYWVDPATGELTEKIKMPFATGR